MELWNKVVLFGNFDGFTYASNDPTHAFVSFENGERVEVPARCVISKDKIVEKDKIKLKDVIKRIEKFDLGTKAVWINEILYKLGSDYGIHKYYAGYKQGKLEGDMEREKVTVPQFVDDWIFKAQLVDRLSMRSALDSATIRLYAKNSAEVIAWLKDIRNQDIFVTAWVNDYEVEKEKKYTVKVKATKEYLCNDELGPHFSPSFRTNFTKSDLAKLGFGWVFDCNGMEVKEVKNE